MVLLSTLLLTEFSVNVTDVIICVLPWMEYHKYILFVLGPTNTSASASHCLPVYKINNNNNNRQLLLMHSKWRSAEVKAEGWEIHFLVQLHWIFLPGSVCVCEWVLDE